MLAPSSAFICGCSLFRSSQTSPAIELSPTNSSPLRDDAAAEAGAQRHAEEVLVALGAARLFQQAVDVGQKTGDGLAIDEEVAVVVDEDRDAELLLEHRPQRHAAAEAGQVAQVANDAGRVVGRARERRS